MATGAYPRTHGIIQNAWWDRESGKLVACTQDDQTTAVSYGAPIAGTGDSARRLLVPTLADQLRLSQGAHVVSLSLKARSAIMLAGQGGDAITWLSDSLDRWETSSAFASAGCRPGPDVRRGARHRRRFRRDLTPPRWPAVIARPTMRRNTVMG